MSSKLENLISQPQLRQILGGVSDTTVWRWRAAGTLPDPVSINGRNYYRESELRTLQERLFAGRQLDRKATEHA